MNFDEWTSSSKESANMTAGPRSESTFREAIFKLFDIELFVVRSISLGGSEESSQQWTVLSLNRYRFVNSADKVPETTLHCSATCCTDRLPLDTIFPCFNVP